MNIGILPGSFNPAHSGHKYISEQALNILNLDQIWWVITPQNPDKNPKDLYPLKKRIESAKEKTKDQAKIIIKQLEEEGKDNYSYLLIDKLVKNHPQDKFYLILGADNIAELHHWEYWHKIIQKVNIIAVPRESSKFEIKNSKFAKDYKKYLLNKSEQDKLLQHKPPYWTILNIEDMDISATMIRQGKIND
jgi:nicotinate-nucleotide adenylyltransferase